MSAPSSSSSSSSSSNFWLGSYEKLKFFSRIRRFLQSKSVQKNKVRTKVTVEEKEAVGAAMDEDEDDCSVVLQRSVKKLHFGNWEEKEVAAMEIERLAKENVKTRKFMAELGVIPVLVGMLDSDLSSRRRLAVKALIELANGTYTNKALMVEAGIFSKLPNNIKSEEESTRTEFAELILSLSSIANTQKFPLTSSQILPFLTEILQSNSSIEAKQSCLTTLYNISSVLENAATLVSNSNGALVQTLMTLISLKHLSEKALATLGHLVVTLMGKKAMENNPMVPQSLIEILTWEDKPKCQELSAYILMIMAYQSSSQRDKMAKSGIVPVLLEVALLGSELAQKRALKLLQWFKDERETRMGPHSGPQTGRVIAMGSPISPRASEEGKKMMKSLVKQSLYKNLEMITRRANNVSSEENSSSKLKSLVISTSSKSLPY
ncbi:U-box domain-containing protein 7 [Euphorbia lathyris]|uniref:U-box domain-containing protein 7 n=1 Tax=Euphorbia lathyris TaxID=212925 RepID=UPI00331341C9